MWKKILCHLTEDTVVISSLFYEQDNEISWFDTEYHSLLSNHVVFTRDGSVPSGKLLTNCELSFPFVICANCRLQ